MRQFTLRGGEGSWRVGTLLRRESVGGEFLGILGGLDGLGGGLLFLGLGRLGGRGLMICCDVVG